MLKIRISIGLLFFLLLTCSFSAKNIMVNTTAEACIIGHENYTTIQAAINAASDGDNITVCSNSTNYYFENIVVNKSVNIHGNQSGVEVYSADPSLIVFNITSNNVNITNFTIVNASISGGIGIFSNGSNTWIHDNTVINCTQGISIRNLNSNVSYNIISNSTVYGIASSLSSTNSYISRNNISITYIGITTITVSNITIIENNIYNGTHAAIEITINSSDIQIISNTLQSTLYGLVIKHNSDGNNATGNDIYNISEFFVYVYDYSDNNLIVSNNLSDHTNQFSLYLSSNSSNNTVLFNVISDCATSGIVSETHNNNISFNNVSDCSGSGAGIRLIHASNNSIYNNNVNGTNQGFVNTGSVYSGNNTFYGNNATRTRGWAYSIGGYNSKLFFNSASNAVGVGFALVGSGSNIVSYNNATANSQDGFYSTSPNNYYSYNNAFDNSRDGLFFSGSNNNTVEQCNTTGNTFYGYYLLNSNNNTFISVISEKGDAQQYGFYLRNSQDNNISSSIAYKHTRGGIYITGTSARNMIEGNTISGHTTNQASGIYLIGLDKLNNIYGNNIIQNNTYGIFLSSSNYTNITGNRINMNTVGLAIGVYSHDINLFGNNLTLNEVAYNITNTTNFTFSGDYDNIGFDFSVEIQTGGMYINSSIPVSADPFGFTNLSRYVNITNHSAVILTLIIPYSDNDLSSLSLDESSLEIMKFDGSKWIGIPATLDKSNNIIQSGNINSFSVFALFARPLVENSISNSKKNINLIPSFVCSTGELEITAKYSQLKLKGIKINLGEKSVITDSLGSAVFTISEDGLYFIYSDPTSKYNGENIKISLSLCIEEEEPEVQNHSRIKENPEHVTDIVETISETVQNTVPKITEEISSIGKEIELPAETDAQETKDTVEPEKEKTLDVYSLILWLIVLIALIIAYLFYRSRK